jgi:general secretion pathway protein G
MAVRRRSSEIFFPWERGGGLLGGRGAARVKPVVAALGMALLLLVLGARERERVGVRSTRATLLVVHRAVEDYRADHDGACPPSLATLEAESYLGVRPVDAWGRPLRLTCPGRRDLAGYDLSSDGPDGEIGGLDRVE